MYSTTADMAILCEPDMQLPKTITVSYLCSRIVNILFCWGCVNILQSFKQDKNVPVISYVDAELGDFYFS